MMDKDEIRLECLRLWHRHDRTPAQVIEMAKEYEKYVLDVQEKKVEEKSSRSKKPIGNPDLFQ
jgi:hypothetical protein